MGVIRDHSYVSHHIEKAYSGVLVALYFIILELVIVTYLALLFSSFSSPLLSAVFAFSLFVIGTLAEELRGFAALTSGMARWVARGLAYLIANFSGLGIIGCVAHGPAVPVLLVRLNRIYA